MSLVQANEAWTLAASLAGLHSCRSQLELDTAMSRELLRVLPRADMAMCVAVDRRDRRRVQFALGGRCPWRQGDTVVPESWPVPAAHRLPVSCRGTEVGELVVAAELTAGERAAVRAMLLHYGTALVNLALDEEARVATEHYCASLQTLEDGIVLFQEEDADAVTARLLSLATGMVGAVAGALYVLRSVGDPGSGLVLEQALGIPESLLATFGSRGGVAWPDCLLGWPSRFAERAPDGSVGALPAGSVPAILRNLVVLPLCYHGVDAGVCVLFNANIDSAHARDQLDRAQSLGHLGAALLHRLRLEALTARNHTIARELEIAETIQKRLLPTRAPATPEFEFAWSSLAAQNIGGDYLDLLTSDLGDIYAVVADASGHGINSALLMSSFRSTYRADAPWMEPNELVERLNEEVVHEVGSTGMFITAATLRIEVDGKRLTLASAGHNPVLHWHARTGRVEPIGSHGPPLGFVAGVHYESHQCQLESGDVLLLYTDGITESSDREAVMFGEERLIELVERHATDPAGELLAAARRALAEFTGRDHYDDDVSLTVIKVR